MKAPMPRSLMLLSVPDWQKLSADAAEGDSALPPYMDEILDRLGINPLSRPNWNVGAPHNERRLILLPFNVSATAAVVLATAFGAAYDWHILAAQDSSGTLVTTTDEVTGETTSTLNPARVPVPAKVSAIALHFPDRVVTDDDGVEISRESFQIGWLPTRGYEPWRAEIAE